MKLQDLSSPQLAKLSFETPVILPIAAIEQHGPHLPLGTDSFIGEAIASRLDKIFKNRLLILPVQRIGYSEHHMSFPGSLTLQHETFEAIILQTINSLIRHQFHRFLILNSHGGNQSIGGVIAEKAAQKWSEAEVIFTSWWKIANDGLKKLVEGKFPSVGHACEFETSLMLALHPALVNMSLATDDGVSLKTAALNGDMLQGAAATLALPFKRLTKQGVYGRPTLATAKKGEQILDEIVSALQKLIENIWPQPW